MTAMSGQQITSHLIWWLLVWHAIWRLIAGYILSNIRALVRQTKLAQHLCDKCLGGWHCFVLILYHHMTNGNYLLTGHYSTLPKIMIASLVAISRWEKDSWARKPFQFPADSFLPFFSEFHIFGFKKPWQCLYTIRDIRDLRRQNFDAW